MVLPPAVRSDHKLTITPCYSGTVTGMASTPDNHGRPAASTDSHFFSSTPPVCPRSSGVGPKRSARDCSLPTSKP